MKNIIIEKYRQEGLVVPGVYDKVFKAIMQDRACRQYLVEIIHELTKLPKEYINENMVIKNTHLRIRTCVFIINLLYLFYANIIGKIKHR